MGLVNRFKRWMKRPVMVEADLEANELRMMLANGRVYVGRLPTWLYFESQLNGSVGMVEFRLDNIYWPDCHNRVYVQPFITHVATEQPDTREVRLKRVAIVLLDHLEALVLRHRFYGVCSLVCQSSWWAMPEWDKMSQEVKSV